MKNIFFQSALWLMMLAPGLLPSVQAQNQIAGTFQDASGQPLSYATVLLLDVAHNSSERGTLSINPNNAPPPTRSTVKSVPPIIKKGKEAQEEQPLAVEELMEKKGDIGAEIKPGHDDAAPTIEEHPSERVVEALAPVIEDKAYELFYIQKPPSFPGGEPELLKFLADNIQYPPLAANKNIQGSVVLTFVVDKDGQVSGVTILRDIGGGCGQEAARVVNAMPRWNPGEANGNPVKARFTLPVRFTLD